MIAELDMGWGIAISIFVLCLFVRLVWSEKPRKED